MKPEEIKRDLVDAEAILDMLDEHRELYLTVKAEDVKTIKQRLSQAKFRRGTEERLRMQEGKPFTYMPTRVTGSGDSIANFKVVDLHLKLGGGADIFVLSCRAADDTL